MKPWLLFLIIFLIGLIIFFPTLKLSLYGDDWLVFSIYSYLFPQGYAPNIWDFLNQLLTRYGLQVTLMGLFRSIYDYQATYYYMTSMILRIIAAFSLYPLTFYLTRSKLAAFFAMLFFSVTTIGLETTEYLAHIPSYISLTFFNLFLYYFLRSREEKELKKLLYSGLFFYLAFVTAPVRMTGLLLFILLIEFFWIIQNWGKKILKKVSLRLSFILLIFLFINVTGNPFFFPTQKNETKPQSNIFLITQTTDSLSNIVKQLENYRFDFLFYPIISFGSMFLPDTAIDNFPTALKKPQLVLLIFFVYSMFAIISLFITRSILQKKIYSYQAILVLTAFWSLISAVVYLANQTTFPGLRFFISLLVGGYMAILGLYLLYKFYHNQLVSQAIFSSLSWSIAAFFIPWLWSPFFLLVTYHRYLIGSAVGISLFLATVISLVKNLKYQKITLSIFFLLIFIHTINTRMHIQKLLENHSAETSSKIWSQMPYIPEVGKSKEPLVFYFEGDGTNGGILNDTITFGFPFHMAVLYNIPEMRRNPISMIDWKDIESAVLDGKSFAPHFGGRVLSPISPARVYAFRLQGKDNLINITDSARKRLTEFLQNQR